MKIINFERIGLEPVPKKLRSVGALELAAIFCNFYINPGTLVTAGLMLTAGLSFWSTIAIQVTAVLTGMIPFMLFARAGVDHGIPGQVLCRAVFGIRGSRTITSLMRITASIYWYAFQTLAGALTIVSILHTEFNINMSLQVIAFYFAALQIIVSMLGFHYLKYLSNWTLPIKISGFIILIWYLVYQDSNHINLPDIFLWKSDNFPYLIALTWFNALISGSYSMMTDASDLSRYAKSIKTMLAGIITGIVSGVFIASFFASFCVVAGGVKSINPFDTIIDSQPGLPIISLVLILIILDNWTINVINLYTGGLSLCNMLDKISRVQSTLIIGLISSSLLFIPDFIEGFADTAAAAGGIFAPATGIMLAWFIYCYKDLSIPDLYKSDGIYWYQHGFNALICTLIPVGFIANHYFPTFIFPAIATMLLTMLVSSWLLSQQHIMVNLQQ